jgi:hypothetical protein
MQLRLTDELDPDALKSALVRGQALSALEGFTVQIAEA